MSGYSKKRERLRRRTLTLLATAIGGAGLAASVPTRLRPHVEGLGEVAIGVLARGGFAALPLAGTLVAAAAILA
jgi:hypothetical protein